MKLLRVKPGHGDVVLAEGDLAVPEQHAQLLAAFRSELDAGMWAAVPTNTSTGRREAELVRNFEEIPLDAERVIFFPRAAGGCRWLPSHPIAAPQRRCSDRVPSR
jgi:hypothetical protein